MVTKDQILAEIRRLVQNGSGVSPGIGGFTNTTGIRRHEWQRYWPRWGDALAEAGAIPNELTTAYTESQLLELLIELTSKLGHFPTRGELGVEAHQSAGFPHYDAFTRCFGPKARWPALVLKQCESTGQSEAVIQSCKNAISGDLGSIDPESAQPSVQDEYVYLCRMGEFYKIGYTNCVDRRSAEIRIQLPQEYETIHVIRTDDPVGIERYWHERFASKRKRGEWFQLNSSDVRAFKRRRSFM